MTNLKTLAVTLAAGLSLAACASSGAMNGTTRTEAYRPEQATVNVENRNWQDVNVYAISGGMRYRLGTVTSMGTTRFRVPQNLTSSARDLRILVDPIGSREEFLSPSVQVYSGQEVSFTVQNHLPISSISVFDRH